MDVHDDGLDAENFHRREELVLASVDKISPLVRRAKKIFNVIVVKVQVGLAQESIHILVERIPDTNSNFGRLS